MIKEQKGNKAVLMSSWNQLPTGASKSWTPSIIYKVYIKVDLTSLVTCVIDTNVKPSGRSCRSLATLQALNAINNFNYWAVSAKGSRKIVSCLTADALTICSKFWIINEKTRQRLRLWSATRSSLCLQLKDIIITGGQLRLSRLWRDHCVTSKSWEKKTPWRIKSLLNLLKVIFPTNLKKKEWIMNKTKPANKFSPLNHLIVLWSFWTDRKRFWKNSTSWVRSLRDRQF